MAYLISDSFKRFYYANKCSLTFLFVLTIFAFIVLFPFFASKASEGFWSVSQKYQEQPWINFRGDYAISCTQQGSDLFFATFSPLNRENSYGFRPNLKIQKYDNNLDTNYDRFQLEFSIYGTSQITKCDIFLIADLGLRGKVNLQMQSPVQFTVQSLQGIGTALVEGDLQFVQKYPLLKSHICRIMYNETVDSDVTNYRDFITSYLSRNESMTASYKSYVLPSLNQPSGPIRIQLNLYPTEFQTITYIPHLFDNIRFVWVQYVALFIPLYYVLTYIPEFAVKKNIFASYVKTNLPERMQKYNKYD